MKRGAHFVPDGRRASAAPAAAARAASASVRIIESSVHEASATKQGRRWPGRLAAFAVASYLALVVASLAAVRLAGDRSVLLLPLLFGPRWILSVPAAALAPWALFARRPALLAPCGLAVALVLGPLMGLRWSEAAPPSPGGRDPRVLRVVSHNLGRVEPRAPAVASLLEDLRPDVVAFQECAPKVVPLAAPGYFTHDGGGLCVLSRYPILEVDSRERTDVREGGAGAVERYVIAAPAGPVHLVNVHLATARAGLEALRRRDLRAARDNLETRAIESRFARRWAARATGPLLVAGDLNLPVDSAIYREQWADLGNAFSEAGTGWGATKLTRWFGVRIDHLLHDASFTCRRAWVGRPTGSDHLPMVADFVRAR